MGIAKVGLRDGPEAFLTCGVPDLDLGDVGAVDLQRLHLKIDAHGVLIASIVARALIADGALLREAQ